MERSIQHFLRTVSLSVVIVTIGFLGLAHGQAESGIGGAEHDRTLSPYFFVKGDDPDTDPLPLKHTSADIKITGIIADVRITQTYKNEGKNTLEAIYIFPASTRAAVHAMRMTIGERVIEAEIMERQKARETYEQAKQEGRTTSLLEQQRPNVFQMNVANILPGDEIKTELLYTELIEPEDQIYEFVFPTVVGPRYSNTSAASATEFEKWVENPYLHSGDPAPYSFDLNLYIETGIPISQLTSPSHDVSVEFSDKTRASVKIKEESKAATKDFVLRYKLAGGRIQSGVMLYPGQDENFFLLMMEPPARVNAKNVVPREYIFIVDVSGSMHGFPINISKTLMKDIITDLRPSDYMNVLLFAGGSAVLSEGTSLPATEKNKKSAIAWVNAQQGGGGTNILPALRRALALPRTEGVSRIVVVLTDGYVSVEPQAFELIRKNLGEANLFAFGIGKSVNRYIIEGMARVGQGEPFVVLDQGEASKQATKFRQYIDSPVLTDIHVSFEGLNAYDVEPIAIPDLFALRPVVVFGKYNGEAAGEVVITGHSASGDFRQALHINKSLVSVKNTALRLLWARSRIMRLSDLNHLGEIDERVEEVTALGLKYSLMTHYTSFVAVDKIKRADGEIVTVKQPLPLPDGVSDLAVGAQSLKMRSLGAMAPVESAAPRMAPRDGSSGVFKEEAFLEAGEIRGNLDFEKATKADRSELTVEEIKGDLDKAVIEKALNVELEALHSCCQNTQRQQLQGETIYRLVIDGNGRVKKVQVVMTTMTNASVVQCVKKILEGIKFTPSSQAPVKVVLKMVCGALR